MKVMEAPEKDTGTRPSVLMNMRRNAPATITSGELDKILEEETHSIEETGENVLLEEEEDDDEEEDYGGL